MCRGLIELKELWEGNTGNWFWSLWEDMIRLIVWRLENLLNEYRCFYRKKLLLPKWRSIPREMLTGIEIYPSPQEADKKELVPWSASAYRVPPGTWHKEEVWLVEPELQHHKAQVADWRWLKIFSSLIEIFKKLSKIINKHNKSDFILWKWKFMISTSPNNIPKYK